MRLEALADTPIGFLETLERAQADSDEDWRARAVRWTAEGSATFLATRPEPAPEPGSGGGALGMLGASVDDVRPHLVWLLAVYVRPAARGAGVLDALVDAAADWARGRGAVELVLEVHEDNARARTAYEKLGFVATGQRQPYGPDPTRNELEMRRPL